MSGAQRRRKKLVNNVLRSQLDVVCSGFNGTGKASVQTGNALASQMKSIGLAAFGPAERKAAAKAWASSRKSINEMVELKRAGQVGMHRIAAAHDVGPAATGNNVLIQFAQYLSKRDVGHIATKFTADLCDARMNY